MADYIEKAATDIVASGCQIIEPEDFDIDAFYANADALVNDKYMSNDLYAPFINEIRERYNYN